MARLVHLRGRRLGLAVALLAAGLLWTLGVSPSAVIGPSVVVAALVVVATTVITAYADGLLLQIEGEWATGDTLTIGPPLPLTGTVVRHLPRVSVLALPDGRRCLVPHALAFGAIIAVGDPLPPPPPTS